MIPVPLNAYSVTALAILLTIFIYVAGDVMGLFPSKNQFPLEGKTVLLTGGSQGMGLGLCKLLAQRGANVVIVARSKDKLATALAEIRAHATSPDTQRFHSIAADVALPETATALLTETTAWNDGEPPDVIWSNAGSSHPVLFSEASVALLRSQMDLNYWGAAYLAHAALALFLRPVSSHQHQRQRADSLRPLSPPRHIVFTCSVTAFVGLAGYAPYSPAKAAMRNLADSLRNEVQLYNAARRRVAAPPEGPASQTAQAQPQVPPDRDIQIHIVFPGTIHSPGFENEEKVKHPVTRLLEKGDPAQTPDEVALAAVRGLERGEYAVSTQWLGRVLQTGMMGGSPRSNIVLDTVLSWIVSVVWLFMIPDLDGKVWGWGKENGMARPKEAETLIEEST